MKKIWFHAKRYGWGWGWPACWQGWIVLLVYLGLMILGAGVFLKKDTESFFLVYVVVLSIGLFLICWWKGEPPRWRWGKD